MTRYVRVETSSGGRYGEVDGEKVWLLTGAPWELDSRRTDESLPLKQAQLLVPTDPSKIICIAQNYRKHAAEMGKPVPPEPVIFLKPPSALNPSGRPIALPPDSGDIHYEAELALIIGARLSKVSEAEALQGIFAISCFNDVTARDIQKREIQHTRAKSYDTFACCGPSMVRGLSPNDLRVEAKVNGVTKQDGRTSDMIFSPAHLVSFISKVMTLLPGDLISTGTPSGVGPLKAGDTVEIEIEGIGVLSNPVVKG